MPDIIMRTHKKRNATNDSMHHDLATKHFEHYIKSHTKHHPHRHDNKQQRNRYHYNSSPSVQSDNESDVSSQNQTATNHIKDKQQMGEREHNSDDDATANTSELQTLSQTVRALKKKDGLIDFTTASATLSAAAKIYSCRFV